MRGGVHILLALPILDRLKINDGRQRKENIIDLVVEWPEKNTELLHNIACIDTEIVTKNANRHVLLNLQPKLFEE